MAEFDAFWSAVDDELARYPAAPELELSPLRKTDYATVYHLKISSIGPYRLFGYYSVPHGNGPFPGLYLTPRYGSVNHVPHPDDRRRYAVLQLMHRGQRLADKPFAAAYPGLLTLGIADPATYIYRAIVADCLRGAEFLLSRPEVDASRVGIRGDDMALLTAARRPGFKAAEVAGLMFYRLMDAAARTDTYPVEEINDHLRGQPGERDAVGCTLALFDPSAHAGRVAATTLLSVGDPGSIGGPEWLEPLASALGGPVEQYRLTHEGATDHDWIDAWTAGQLGVAPRPRLWEIAAGD
jgi:cephalosporin-C deacetylase-like acetyl esterase